MHSEDDQIVPYQAAGPLSAKLLKNGTLGQTAPSRARVKELAVMPGATIPRARGRDATLDQFWSHAFGVRSDAANARQKGT